MNLEVDDDDPMLLISQYYPIDIISQFVPEQGGAQEANIKPRRRRRKNKGGEGGSDVVMMMMRKRRLNEEQVSMLEQSFASEKKLESERKERLAAELGLDPRQVAVWFQNRRARWRNKKLEEEYSRLKSEHETTVVEKCLLENELLKVMEKLHEAEKEIKRLSDTRSNSPSSSLSMENNMELPLFLGEFGMEGLENVFYLPENNYNYCGHGGEWDNIYDI